jgi:hypothetical protein
MVFGLFVEWTYYGEYTVLQSTALSSNAHKDVDPNVGAWILGDKLLSTDFKNYAMQRLYALYTSNFTCRAVTTNDVQHVCENTAMDSRLRKFFLAFVVENLHTLCDWKGRLRSGTSFC